MQLNTDGRRHSPGCVSSLEQTGDSDPLKSQLQATHGKSEYGETYTDTHTEFKMNDIFHIFEGTQVYHPGGLVVCRQYSGVAPGQVCRIHQRNSHS